MTLNKICALVAFGLEVLDLITFLIRLKKAGPLNKEAYDKPFITKLIVIYACVVIIPAICIFMDFGTVGNIALCGCAVLGLELANRDLLTIGKTEAEAK